MLDTLMLSMLFVKLIIYVKYNFTYPLLYYISIFKLREEQYSIIFSVLVLSMWWAHTKELKQKSQRPAIPQDLTLFL